jgi:hypothetical protein
LSSKPRLSPGAAAAVGCVIALASWFAACSAKPPVANSHASPGELARAVLSAFERRDLAALRALALDEREFKDHVWPELPAARPERNLPFSFVWGDLHQKSEASLGAALSGRGGQHFELVAVKFLGDTTQYETYVVHRRSSLTVKDASGAEQEVRLFGSVFEKDGRFKVFSYVVD